MKTTSRNPVNRIRYVGGSVHLTIDPMHIKRLSIDSLTFFEEEPIENGILLRMRKLDNSEGDDGKKR
jgi:hypothetical protein